MKWLQGLALSLLVACLVSCSRSEPAPVFSAWNQSRVASLYRVQPGDTLYSVAFAYGFDYREMAKINHLKWPYIIKVGEYLITKRPSVKRAVKPKVKSKSLPKPRVQSRPNWRKNRTKPPKKAHSVVKKSTPKVSHKRKSKHRLVTPKHWRWPVKSKVLQRFKKGFGHSQGIDLAGWKGRSVVATAAGVVVYSGTGIRGYGNLVIIKHSEEYLSAYAYASKRLVRTGQWVKAGQTIAKMGQDSYKRVRLHFEIRKRGTPVDPLRYLQRQH